MFLSRCNCERNWGLWRFKKSCLATLAFAAICFTHSAPATLLNLTSSSPDFMASFVNVSYNSSTHVFQASGFTSDYEGGSVSLVDLGNYSLSATISSAGVLSSGSVSISGDIGSGNELLLSGTLNPGAGGVAYGYQNAPGGNLFEFLFTVTGGDAAVVQDFGGIGGGSRGIILNAYFENGGVPFSGTWASGFYNNGFSGVADNFLQTTQIPEPGLGYFALLAAGALYWASRFSRVKPPGLARVRISKNSKY